MNWYMYLVKNNPMVIILLVDPVIVITLTFFLIYVGAVALYLIAWSKFLTPIKAFKLLRVFLQGLFR